MQPEENNISKENGERADQVTEQLKREKASKAKLKGSSHASGRQKGGESDRKGGKGQNDPGDSKGKREHRPTS
jgi:hypothetical protein